MKWRLNNRITIVGAGQAGVAIAGEIRAKGIFGRVVAFLDDDPDKIGRRIQGVPIVGPIEDVVAALNATPDDEAIIAMPSASRAQLRSVYDLLRRAGFARIRHLPGLSQVLDGDAHLVLTREINPEDLLSRDPVAVSLRESLAYVRGKRVLVTGAGGSIGSELARQLLSGGAQRLYLFGHGENSIFGIDRELRLLQSEGVGEAATIVPVIGELQDRDYVRYLMSRLRADIVFHTAAHKHVALMEANPVAAVKNNVFGTRNLIEASLESAVSSLVLISTDKAVEPTCVYGASKRIAEELVLRERARGARFLVVRFGNVLASRGSILPLFQEQIRTGGPVTITDPEATRFFMTIPEASSLVLKAGGVDVDADMLLLDMGEPVRIRDLAERMIEFHGYQPGADIPIAYTGLRPGEKLHEALWAPGEVPGPTPYPGILALKRSGGLPVSLDALLAELEPICSLDPARPGLYRNRRALRETLRRAIPTLEAPVMSPSTEFIPFARPTLGLEEEQAAVEVIRSGWLTTGPQAAAFEREFAEYVGARHALAVCSATAGLHLALESLGIGPGDAVATTPYTFTATAEVIRYLGADPVFVDIDPRTYNLDPGLLARARAAWGSRLKAVVPVHVGGLPCAMDELAAAAPGVPVVEDAAHAFPVTVGGRFAGLLGELGVYSFYANKTMTTGEGGMVVTDRDDLAARVRVMRNHGIDREAWSRYTSAEASWRYAVVAAGFKYNLTDIAAAIGRVQLRRAASFLQERRRVAAAYLRGLAGLEFLELPVAAEAHAWHLFLLRLRPGRLGITRDRFIEELRARGIGTSVHYIPLHLMPYYSERYSLKPSDFPVALDCYERTISLPIYPALTDEQAGRVVEAVRQIGYSSAR